VYTDFATQRRQPKASARWYSALITANAVPDPAAFAGEGSCCLALGAATEARGGRPALAALAVATVTLALGALLSWVMRRRQGGAAATDSALAKLRAGSLAGPWAGASTPPAASAREAGEG